MLFDDVIAQRRSIRAFKSDPVPLAVVRELLETAARSPSGTNVQPWKVHVAAGAVRMQVLELKESTLIKVAQGMLALPQAPAPPASQRAVDYLGTLAEAKAKAADWPGLQQVLAILAQVAGPDNTPPSLQEDTAAVRAYLIGEKLEAAGQTLDAIRSYRQSLATLGKYFPADPPAAKLKELAARFPDVYRQAIQQPIARTP